MVEVYGRKLSRSELLRRVGDMSQLGGLRRMTIAEGPGKGVGTVEVNTGSGLTYTILLDRGMDISAAGYQGRSLCWRSSTGDRHPAFFEPEGLGWLRLFFGGLMITCGMTQVGAPCEDQGEELGVHGRFTSLPAERIRLIEEWDGQDYIMAVEGELRESVVFGVNLVCRRRISSWLGKNRIVVEDKVANEGHKPTPHMYLYHCNFGYPLVDEGTRLLTPARKVIPRDADAKAGSREYQRMSGPVPRFREQIFFHDLSRNRRGETCVALINEDFGDGEGFGVVMRYPVESLPHFTQWKMMGERTYTCGLEPGNCRVLGRAQERAEGRLVTLRPGQSVNYRLELEVLTNQKEIRKVRKEIRAMR